MCDPALLEEWIHDINGYAAFLPGFEFTIEANPETLTEEFARRVFQAGINRLIIGSQSFSVSSLKLVGRKQRNKDIYQAFYNARLAGFENIGADLIFGLPGQTIKKLRTDIDRLTSLEPKHISFYQLTVEPGTLLEKNIESGAIVVPDDDACAEMYLLGSHLLHDKKYLRYEISNYALEGFESKHNSGYWNSTPYIGLGPAAHGFVNNQRYSNIADVDEYIRRIESGVLPIDFVEELSARDKLNEAILLSLRTTRGINKENLIREFGEPALSILESSSIAVYLNEGFLEVTDGYLKLTDRGFLVADKIISDLLS